MIWINEQFGICWEKNLLSQLEMNQNSADIHEQYKNGIL